MCIFIAGTVNKQGKRYYVLKRNVWTHERGLRQEYIGWLGNEKKLTKENACKICEAKGLRLEELARARGLVIL